MALTSLIINDFVVFFLIRPFNLRVFLCQINCPLFASSERLKRPDATATRSIGRYNAEVTLSYTFFV